MNEDIFPESLDDLHDDIITQKAVRQLQQAIDDGLITPEEIANAPVIMYTQVCDCDNFEVTDNGRCTKCLTKCKEERVE